MEPWLGMKQDGSRPDECREAVDMEQEEVWPNESRDAVYPPWGGYMTQWEAADALDMPQWEAVDMEQDESRELPLHPEMVAGKKMP